MADVIATAQGAKTAADVISVWVPVISTLSGGVLAGGVALLVSRLNHRYAREREETASAERRLRADMAIKDKADKELYFIATELLFLLERFAEECAGIATDDGEYDASGERDPVTRLPVLTLDDVEGDWRVLPGLLMFRIRELPVLQHESRRMIAGAAEYDNPPDYRCYFQERQYQYARLGLKAIIQARRLRQSAGLPDTRLDATNWSAQPAMWTVWRRERRRRAADAIRKAEIERILNAEDDPEADARSDEHQRLSGAES